MPAGIRVASRVRDSILLLSAISIMIFATIAIPASGSAVQDSEDGSVGARVRIVHGIGDAGPLDIYVDGSLALIGIRFADTSGNVVLQGGEHAFTVVPTGAASEAAIASGTIAVSEDTLAYAALLGTLDSASVGLFEVDVRSLDPDRARFRIISGVPDVDELTPIFSGGDALSEPLGFGDASEYASIDAGTYDLDLLESATGAPLLALPQTPFPEGTTTDLILVGQVSDGSLTALVQPIQVELNRPVGWFAQIYSGNCLDLDAIAADLGVVQEGQGAAVGSGGTDPVAQGFGTAGVPFASLVESPHAVAISEDADFGRAIVACGDIAGNLTDTGALVIALRSQETGVVAGVAVLAPALDNPEVTSGSVFLIAGAPVVGAVATPGVTVD